LFMLLVIGLFQSNKNIFLLHINNLHLAIIRHQPIIFTLNGLEVIMSFEMNLVKFIVLLSQGLSLFYCFVSISRFVYYP
jgi:hypothetical protein